MPEIFSNMDMALRDAPPQDVPQDRPPDAAQDTSTPAADIHEPFTKLERMQQLSEIDRDICTLLEKASRALAALTKPPTPKPSATDGTTVQTDHSAITTQEQQQQQSRAFESASNDFFTTLQSIHVRLKRQIYSLEEAGIISLKDNKTPATVSSTAPAATATAAAAAANTLPLPTNLVVPALEPNGVGGIGTGSLDVGWLNSRSTKVDRDMEAELWAAARANLEALAARELAGDPDVTMLG